MKRRLGAAAFLLISPLRHRLVVGPTKSHTAMPQFSETITLAQAPAPPAAAVHAPCHRARVVGQSTAPPSVTRPAPHLHHPCTHAPTRARETAREREREREACRTGRDDAAAETTGGRCAYLLCHGAISVVSCGWIETAYVEGWGVWSRHGM